MMGWRRRAKLERDTAISREHLYELVQQALMKNFGPLGSYAITRRQASDTDDIFHTMLASSVAHDIVARVVENEAIRLTVDTTLAPLESVVVPDKLANAITKATAAPSFPLAPLNNSDSRESAEKASETAEQLEELVRSA